MAISRGCWLAIALAPALMIAAGSLASAQSGIATASDSASRVTDNAQAGPSSSPVDEFSRELEDFQKNVPDLNKKIQDATAAIDSTNNIESAKADIDQLRGEVSAVLGSISDNGPVSHLGTKALNHIHDKIRTLSQDNRFKPEEKQYLLDQWQRLQTQTETATKELDDARAQFAGLLQTLQSNEDFISELMEIRQAEKALDIIRGLTHDIRDASTQLNKLIGSIKPPGA